MQYEFPFQDALDKLNVLLSQNQFELLVPNTAVSSQQTSDIRLVYLMNDAVESFLVFKEAVLTGTYLKEYEGELEARLDESEGRYVLAVYQGETVCTLFFQNLTLEVHLYDYSGTGHFWVKGYEYLRQLEYRIAILRDKREYLGEEYCTEQEVKLSYLAEFPPLNYCSYPAVPDKYLVPSYDWWQVSDEAVEEMKYLGKEADDKSLLRWLKIYEFYPKRAVAKKIARMLHTSAHSAVVELIDHKLKLATAEFGNRVFDKDEERHINDLKKKAQKRKTELLQNGKHVEMLKEEPFVYAKDGIESKIHLMIWDGDTRNEWVEVETFEQAIIGSSSLDFQIQECYNNIAVGKNLRNSVKLKGCGMCRHSSAGQSTRLLSACWNEDFLLTEYDVSQYLSRIEGSPPKRNAAGSIPVWDVW